MRALFLAGYVPEAAAVMRGWLAAGNDIAAVWNPEMQRRGQKHRDARMALLAPRWSMMATARRGGIDRSEVPRLATWEHGLEALAATGADVLISVYFPFRIPQGMIDAVGGRAVNFHPAPLPRYRGPVPFHAMIMDRSIEHAGAMTLHVIDAGLDEGAVIACEPIAFPPDRSLVRYRLSAARAAEMLATTRLPAFLRGEIVPVRQDEAAARYLRAQDIDMGIRSDLHAEEIRWRCDAFASQVAIPIDGLPGVMAVGFDRILGRPTGAASVVRAFSIDLDCRDARIRLRRKAPWSTPFRRLKTAAIHMAEPA